MAIDAISGAVYKEVVQPEQKVNLVNLQSKVVDTLIKPPAKMEISTKEGGSQPESGQRDNEVLEKQIKDAITRANDKLKVSRTKCEFTYHDEVKRVSIKVIDMDTEQIIREIPPEETIELVKKLWELAGLLIDEKR